ncbi:MAG TPA: long-chain fatty acid--CoA ligase [Polyangiaceae bacterium]|nr:long-chain fatty acid--CoA ligase [Polyangiaceae bacterium]
MATRGTMLAQIEDWAQRQPHAPALHDRTSAGGWDITSYRGYWHELRRVGKGLMAIGVQPEDCVAIVGANRPDWVICQHGINAAQAIPAPLYVTLLADQMAYIIGNAQAKVAICDDRIQLDKLLAIREAGETLIEWIVTMDPLDSDADKVISLDELKARGDALSDADLEARINAVKNDDVALLIYTSGTTGKPKGAMFTHEGIELIGSATAAVFPFMISPETTMLSYLPLCHAAEQGMTNFAGLMTGGKVYFCRDMKKIKDHLVDVRPSVFLAVPRVWEKFEAALRGKMAEASPTKAKILKWARETELRGFLRDNRGESGRPSLRRWLANKKVIGPIKEALGLDRLKVSLSGAAPISTSTLEFFASIGIAIHEGYGMTETTAFASVQPYGRIKFGTIGKPLRGVQVKIADDGEIMLKGRNMVSGYYRLPEKTAELYDEEGWMHTGDLGEIDSDGYISITGRKKDLIITAGGKNVAPAEMEGLLQSIPGVGQAVVVGDRQPYLCALIVLDPDALPALEKASGISGLTSVQVAATHPGVNSFIEEQVKSECNAHVARYQTIKKFKILEDTFSVDGGELTPTLKVKRNVVNEKYASVIDELYGTGTVPVRA